MQTKEQKSPIETAIESAKETCESGSAGACATAWDEVGGAAVVSPWTWLRSWISIVDREPGAFQVEELSASAADKKQAKGTQDPLDKYCDDNPEADECR